MRSMVRRTSCNCKRDSADISVLQVESATEVLKDQFLDHNNC